MQQSSFKTKYFLDLPIEHTTFQELKAVLFVKEEGATLVLLSLENELLSCRTFMNADELAEDIFLRLLFEKEKILTQNFNTFSILASHSNFALAPISSVPQRQLLHYARLMLDEGLFEEEFVYNKIAELEAWVVFSSPSARQHIIQEYVSAAEYGHVCEAMIRFSQVIEEKDFVLLQLYDQMAIIIAYRDGMLQLCNLFKFRASADLLYFLHSVRKASQLEEEDIPIFIMGDLEGRMSDLKAHLPHIKVPTALTQRLSSPHAQSMPYWEFAFLCWGSRT